MIRAPEYYDPLDNPRRLGHPAAQRRDEPHGGAGLAVAAAEARRRGGEARRSGWRRHVGKLKLKVPPFFVTYMKEQIIEDPNGWYGALGETSERAAQGASRAVACEIITTLDPDWQQATQRSPRTSPGRRRRVDPDYEPKPDVAIVSIDDATGAIRTLLSGRNYQQGPEGRWPMTGQAARLVVQAVHARGGASRRASRRGSVYSSKSRTS